MCVVSLASNRSSNVLADSSNILAIPPPSQGLRRKGIDFRSSGLPPARVRYPRDLSPCARLELKFSSHGFALAAARLRFQIFISFRPGRTHQVKAAQSATNRRLKWTNWAKNGVSYLVEPNSACRYVTPRCPGPGDRAASAFYQALRWILKHPTLS